MTVYVDDWFQAARVGNLRAVWSHLYCGPWDDISELHQLAARIGLRRDWFQGDPAHPWPKQHYDVTKTKREAAIRAGAVPVTWHDTGEMIIKALRRGRDNPPPGEPQAGPLTLF